MPARRLQHASVEVPAGLLDACSAFYCDVLGMRPIENLAGRAWFEFGDGDHVHLLEGHPSGSSSAHFAVLVDDLAETLDRVRAAGLAARPGSALWGAERWFVRDPAGNLVELFDQAPAPTPT